MKTKEELNALKEEVETVNEKLRELTDEELAQVSFWGKCRKSEACRRLIASPALDSGAWERGARPTNGGTKAPPYG